MTKKKITEQELEDCSFSPNVNPSSAKMAEKKRLERMRKVLGENKRGQPTSLLGRAIHQSRSSNIFKELHEDSFQKKFKKAERPQDISELERDPRAYTFRPNSSSKENIFSTSLLQS